MKKFIFAAVGVFFLSIYIVSSSSDLMKKITQYRFLTESILKSSKYRFGDLYGVSYLADFKKEVWKEKTVIERDTCSFSREINLFCICDSYLYSFIQSPSIFCGVKTYKFTRWYLDGPIETELDSTKVNVLLIERTERYFPFTPLADYLNRIKLVKKHAIVKSEKAEIIRQNASLCFIDHEKIMAIYNMIYNKNIDQNIEFNLFDYMIFSPLKELKAQLNYKVFGRTNKEVSVIPDKPYLFLSETVDPRSGSSSFIPISDEQISSTVATLNSTYAYYRNNGFDAVCFSIIPNPISIICPGYKPYNDIIRRVQNHPDLIMPMVNIYDRFASATCQVYHTADSHWNYNGFNLWVNEINKYLRSVDKVKK